MSWSGSILGGLAGGALLACAPGPQAVAPTPVTAKAPASPASVVAPVKAEPVAEPGLRARLCGERAPCQLRRTRVAGSDAEGRALAVVSVELGEGEEDGSFTEEGLVDSFTAAGQGKCRTIEYWLVVGDVQAPALRVPLLQVCNEGNGAAGLGEDTVTIAERSLEHASFGGSNWRWSRTQRLELAPLRLREIDFDGSFVMGPNRQQGGWSFERFAGSMQWYSPPCDRESGRPLAVEEAAQVEWSYSLIPSVTVDRAYSEAWQQTGIGACGLALGDADAGLRVVAAGSSLFVEIEDDQVTAGDRIELWLADAAASYMDPCVDGEAGGLRSWELGVRDGRVVAGHGEPEVAGLTVERGAGTPLRMRLTPRGGFAAVSVVYVDRDAREKQARRVATSALVPGRRETLGRLEVIDAAAASCAVVAGRLEPVRHAYTGAGPMLR